VEWLLSDAPPVTVLIDGYNVGFVLAGPGDPAAARQRLELELSRLVTLASGRLAAVVVYDSADGGTERSPRRHGIEVLFTSGRTADDVLVELVRDLSGRRVVVSNDRAVRERSEKAGAVALWSDALAAWSVRS
jgi:predicted RNA-binding protein with PIN domain